jgi:hypothetical protein
MVSHFQQLCTESGAIAMNVQPARQEGLGERALDRARAVVCALLHRHDNLLQFRQNRMFLKCFSCGHESPGWELHETRLTALGRKDSRRYTFARRELVGARPMPRH